MAKKSFLKKNAIKGAGGVAINFAVRSAGTMAGMAGAKLAQEKMPKLGKFAGPVLAGLGLLGEIFIDNDTVAAGAQGLSTAGVIMSTKEFAPDKVKEFVGLSGIGANKAVTTNWEEMAQQALYAQEDSDMSGIQDAELVEDDELDVFADPLMAE